MAERTPRAIFFGLGGATLSQEERRFFAEVDPLGFILFARNCEEPDQVRALVNALKAAVGRADALVLIDQEGGRVQRLKPPRWRAAPAMSMFGALCTRDRGPAVEAAYLNARLLAAELADSNISVDCAPVLDVRQPNGHNVIGDRAFAADCETVALLGRATCAGLLAGGVLPVIKHVPGHGRATRDSHESLPVVYAPLEELRMVDFAPFTALADMPLAMTAHVVYSALDPSAPATISRKVIVEVVRGMIGFDGLLISDDICMHALAGRPGDRARSALAAGCDVVLHCNGNLREMREVAEASPPLTAEAQRRLRRARAMLTPPQAFDRPAADRRLAALVGTTAMA